MFKRDKKEKKKDKKKKVTTTDNNVLFVSKKAANGATQKVEDLQFTFCKNLGEADDVIDAGKTSFSALVFCFDEKKRLAKGEEGAKDEQAAGKVKAGLMRQESTIIAFMSKVLRQRKDTFVCILFKNPKNITALRRTSLLQGGAHMVTADSGMLSAALAQAVLVGGGPYTCPYCTKSKLTEDQLWAHCPMFHGKEPNQLDTTCPVCKVVPRAPFQVHLRNEHGPVGRGEMHKEEKGGSELHAFALVVCQREQDGKFLLVHEPANWGWWLPGGRMDSNETFEEAAVRETKEEGGVDVELLGVLRVEFTPTGRWSRMRVIFYAKPVSEEQLPKSLPDYESCGACWVGVEELEDLPLRGKEPLQWFNYVARGGAVSPMSILTLEGAKPPDV